MSQKTIYHKGLKWAKIGEIKKQNTAADLQSVTKKYNIFFNRIGIAESE
jgi:hypothetical protein